MRLPFQIGIMIGITAIAAMLTWWVQGPPNRALPCSPKDLKPDEICLTMIPSDRKMVWVDARSREAWKKNGLAGSILWNLDATEDMQAFEAECAMKIADTPYVVVYCGDEQCGTSRQIAERIRALGMGAEVHVLRGGWRALWEAGKIKDPKQTP